MTGVGVTGVGSADRVVWIDRADPASAVALAGSKIGRLVELHRTGHRVPAGFAVTVAAYREHCRDSGLDERITEVLAALDPDPPDSELAAASARVRELFERTPMSDRLAAAIGAGYQELCRRRSTVDLPTAVRSSATGEDSADASFAGIFDTYLGVSGPQPVLDAVRSCWGSLFTTRALAYRMRNGITHHEMPIAVGVIELVQARAAGVAFSVHPVSGKRDRVVIEASWGWGEALVQGLVDPDHVEVGRSDRRVLGYRVAHKGTVSTFDAAAGRVREIAMPAPLADRRVLDDEQIGAVTDAVIAIEGHYGFPVDVEWVLDRRRRPGEPVCIVQARPVTVLAAAEQTPDRYDPVAMAHRHVFGGRPLPDRG